MNASTQTDTQPLWNNIRITDGGIVFTPKDSATYEEIVEKMDADYPEQEFRWRLFGTLGKEDCCVAVWKVACADSDEEDDEDCEWCGEKLGWRE
jgi:hypothetical protein